MTIRTGRGCESVASMRRRASDGRRLVRVEYQVAPFGPDRPWFAIIVPAAERSIREKIKELLASKYGPTNIRFKR